MVQHEEHDFKIPTIKKIGIHPVEDGNANNRGRQNFHVLSPSTIATLAACPDEASSSELFFAKFPKQHR